MPSDARTPQLAIGAETPRPIKLRKDSKKIAFGIRRVAVTIIGPIAFGLCVLRGFFLLLLRVFLLRG